MMRAEIIPIDSVSRSARHEWAEETRMEGFTKALGALNNLKGSSMRETIIALENWEASELLSKAEADALYEWHGWRRGQ